MTVEVIDRVKEIFSSAQHGTSGHRKLIHNLRSLHLQTAKREGAEGEKSFFLSLIHCLNVLLAVKKTEDAVSRTLRFFVGFIVWSAEHDEDSAVLCGSTPTSRLIENLMRYALEGIDSKDKLVRVRLAQLLVACVNSVDEVSDGVWQIFRVKMTERLFDKEASVRVQAVHAMSRLQDLPLSDDGESSLTVLDIFMDLLAHDNVVEVRRAVLRNIEVNDRSLPAILQRARDVDPSVRRQFYTQKMSEIDVRTLSIQQRDAILRGGLNDRDRSVRSACIEMVFGIWIRTANNNLIQLLLSLDVIMNVKVAESALKAFYELAPDMFAEFPPVFFENLTPETALALRVYVQGKRSTEVGDLLPELSLLAGYIRSQYETLMTIPVVDGSEEEVQHAIEVEFIIKELFLVAALQDMSDEVGRRALQDVLVSMMANLQMSDSIFECALQLLCKSAPSVDEYFVVVGQLVSDLHELYTSSDSQEDIPSVDRELQRSLESLCLTPGDKDGVVDEDVRLMAQVRCLEIIITALSLPSASLSTHPFFLELINDIVVPAINSTFAAVQVKGLTALGLACTLSLPLTLEYSSLIMDFYRLGLEDTRHIALKSAGDDESFLKLKEESLTLLSTSLYDADQELQSISVEGYSKLLLHRITTSLEIIQGLLQLYLHPATAENVRLRQALSYFFQAFAYSNSGNQCLMTGAVVPVLKGTLLLAEHLKLVTPLQLGMQLIELCDPTNLIEHAIRNPGDHPPSLLAESLAWAALESLDEPTHLRLFTQLLVRIRLDQGWSVSSLKRLLFISGQLIRVIPPSEKALVASVKKLITALVELDDATVALTAEELDELRQRLAACHLPAATQNVQNVPVLPKKKLGSSSKSTTVDTNIMDEITDLLEDEC